MIKGITTTVRQDVKEICNFIRGKTPHTSEQSKSDQNTRIKYAAARMFALFGMIVGAVKTIGAVPLLVFSPIGGSFGIVLGVAIFVLSHDVFIMLKNKTDQNSFTQVKANVGSKMKDWADIVQGNKDIKDAPRHPMTEGTWLRFLWDNTIYAPKKA